MHCRPLIINNIIYHDVLPPPRKGSHVNAVDTHKIINIHPLAHTVRHMEDKIKNLGVIFDSHLSFEHHIKSLCSRLNGTLSYLNRVKNTLDQKSRILLINALIFSHLNHCSSIWGKCTEKLQYEVQKCINFAAKVASNGKYLKRDNVTPLLRDLKWINFSSILRLN